MTTVKEHIEQLKNASRQNRQKAADFVLQHPEHFEELLNLAFDTGYLWHHKAAWVVEFVYKAQPEWLYPHLDFFTRSLTGLQKDSAIRPIGKVCELLSDSYHKKSNWLLVNSIQQEQLDRIVSVAFDWLIGAYQVAPKVYAMQILYNLGSLPESQVWILQELKAILSENLYQEQKAYQARAKYLLLKIKD